MPAYVIFIREVTFDKSELDAYAAAAPAIPHTNGSFIAE
ncbi:MAG: hypothetical protein JWO72_2993 [Caulobacteraceae bacterium]|jgi:hypothetical protein|nr:hypothetical protein [Caulobacteraceae bacterium]